MNLHAETWIISQEITSVWRMSRMRISLCLVWKHLQNNSLWTPVTGSQLSQTWSFLVLWTFRGEKIRRELGGSGKDSEWILRWFWIPCDRWGKDGGGITIEFHVKNSSRICKGMKNKSRGPPRKREEEVRRCTAIRGQGGGTIVKKNEVIWFKVPSLLPPWSTTCEDSNIYHLFLVDSVGECGPIISATKPRYRGRVMDLFGEKAFQCMRVTTYVNMIWLYEV